MPTPPRGARLGGSPAHERLILANLATSLFTHGRITTTETKAKRLRPYAERLITKARRGDLHNRRQIMRVIRDKDVVHKLIAEIGPHFVGRAGGYTRIVKTMPRKGDNAPMAVIELVMESTVTAEAERARRARFTRDRAKPAAAGQRSAAAAATSETAQPHVAASEATQPEVVQPEAVQPEAIQSEAVQPEDAGSTAAEPVSDDSPDAGKS